MKRDQWINWALFLLLSCIWGSSFILMRISREVLSGVQIGATRIFSAGVFFLPAAIFHIAKIPRHKLALVVLSGLLGNLFPAFLFGIAIEHHMDSALAGILNSLTPLFVILIALLFGAAFQRKKMVGVLVGLAGLIILSFSKNGIHTGNGPHAFLILLATLMYGLNVNIVARYLKGVEPLKIATVSLAVMAIPAGIIMAQQHVFSIMRYDEEALLPIAAAVLLGVMGSALANVLFYALIQRAGGLFASMVTYVVPVVAIGWGLLAHENVTVLQVGCLAVILSGVYLVNRSV